MSHVAIEDKDIGDNHNTIAAPTPHRNRRKMLPHKNPNHDRNDQIWQQLDREFNCEHREVAIAVKKQQNGLCYFRQCQRCGNVDPLRGVELSDEENDSSIPFDGEIGGRWWRTSYERAAELYERDRQKEKEELDRWYQDYLTTPE